MKIVELMRIPKEKHDDGWLRLSLQSAVELELSTIPLYLCAMWSIKTPSGPVFELIRSIVFEEMLHLGLACNLLTSLGGAPVMTTLLTAPAYPGPLPGGVRPGLTVYLSGLTRQMVKEVFMEIELPETQPVTPEIDMSGYPTIGNFYDAISDALVDNAAKITGKNQLSAQNPLLGNLFPIQSVADATKAISEIKEQGEGTGKSPLAADFGDELAHYYKFAEIFKGNQYVKDANGNWDFKGDSIPFPEVFPAARVPRGGYPSEPGAVAFSKLYTQLLQQLEGAWKNGDQDQLDDAMMETMPQLRQAAVALFQKPIDAGGYTYAPDFQLVS